MAKSKNVVNLQDEVKSTFPVPFTLDEFRKDVTEVCFHYVRTIGWMFTSQTAFGILNVVKNKDDSDEIYDPEFDAFDLGITYEHVRESGFVKALERLYEYAFHGRWDSSAESMEYESYYMWVSDLVSDALYSEISAQWDSYGVNIHKHAKNCLIVAETANARNILEGGEPFSYFSKGNARSDYLTDDSLTIRQMALLSGMEEMSIRSAANPKRANQLVTYTEEGGTRIKLDVAKSWLQSKGRYVPIKTFRSAGEIDLANRKFADYLDIWLALNARFLLIADKYSLEVVSQKLNRIGLTFKQSIGGVHLELSDDSYGNENLMYSLGEILELPAELLVLRCKEVVAYEQLANVEKKISNIVNQSNVKEPK